MSAATQAGDTPAFVPRSRLTVLIDFRSSHAYLAKNATVALELGTSIDADWLPLRITHPNRTGTATADLEQPTDRGARHRRARARYYEQDLQRYVRLRGLTVSDVYPPCDSTPPGLGLLWLRDAPASVRTRYVDLIFERHFGQHMELGDVCAALSASGADGSAFTQFAAQAGPAEFELLQRTLRATGCTTTPTYLLDGEQFQGRQHMPLLRWLLLGRPGNAPL